MYAWGYNATEFNQTVIPDSLQYKASDLECGGHFTLAKGKDGKIYGWGSDFNYELNIPKNLDNPKILTSGTFHSAALTQDNKIVMWGYDIYNQLKVPDYLKDVQFLSAGGAYTDAYTKSGLLVGWGQRNFIIFP